MRLRRQLLLLALLFLLLPLAGLMFLREIEQLLRLGQEQALIASGRAVADRIAGDHLLYEQVASSNVSYTAGQPLYSFSGGQSVVLDGYSDDWRFLQLQQSQFSHEGFAWQLKLVEQNERLLGFLTVQDPAVEFHNPAIGFPASGDFVALYHRSDTTQGLLVFRTSAPGEMRTAYSKDGQVEGQALGARAWWREQPGGYQVEFSVPRSVVPGALTLGVFDSSKKQWLSNMGVANSDPQQLLQNLTVWPAVRPVQQNTILQQAVEVFTHGGNRIRIVNRAQWVLAEENQLNEFSEPPPMSWLIKRLIADQPLDRVAREVRQARLNAVEIRDSLDSVTPQANWYQWDQNSNLARVSVPIMQQNALGLPAPVKGVEDAAHELNAIGAVVVEQTTHQWLAMADRAFKRLLFYSFLVMGMLTAILFLYASWLSIRVQRLSRAAQNAINSDGSINAQFPRARINDEIGDLQTHYGLLLKRVGQYNDYLRSLAVNLSHELRTPLAIVNSSLENLKSTQNFSDSGRIYLTRAQEGSERLAQIFTAISSARSVEEAVTSTEVELIDLAELMAELGHAYATVPRIESLALNLDLPPDPVWVDGSADLIVQMLDKLFDNALDFCSADGEITIGLMQAEQGAHLWVDNTGPLLPNTMADQLFSSMVSLRSGKGDRPHLGLGLYIVKLVVDFHAGEVRARNRSDGAGVVFDIFLPADNR